MTRDQYLSNLTQAGFSFKGLWSAKEQGERYDNVRAYVIYAPDGKLLTSIILRDYQPGGVNPIREVAAYFCSENVTMAADIDELRGMWATRLKKGAA